jgi:hypothetical protein
MSLEREVAFARAVAWGAKGPEAARRAGYGGRPAVLRTTAWRLRKRPAVRTELARVDAEARKGAVATRTEVVQMLSRMIRWSFAEVMDADGRLDPRLLAKPAAMDNFEYVKVTKRGIALRPVDRLRAIDLLARMNGWYAPHRVVYHVEGLGEITSEQARRLEAGEPWLEVLFGAPRGAGPAPKDTLTNVDDQEKPHRASEGAGERPRAA